MFIWRSRRYIVCDLFHILECGVPPATRIVGGAPVSPYSLPWQVGLVAPWDYRTFCGGTLISANHVLTAAHCMGGQFDIIVGEHDLNIDEDGTRHKVSDKTIHPRYRKGAPLNFDFAMVTLKKAVKLGFRAVPACLPDSSMKRNALTGKNVVVSGWGDLSEGGNQAMVLHSVSIPVISLNTCKRKYNSWLITDAMLCAGNLEEGGVDSCQGDSGGN